MYVLFDTAAGYALFKVTDSSKIASTEDVLKTFSTAESAKSALKLKAFEKFADTTKALSAITAICDGQLDENLSEFLRNNLKEKKSDSEKLKLAVLDKNLGNLIKTNLSIKCVYDESILELMRGIRAHLTTLLSGLSQAESHSMRLGLAHSLARYKLKFSPDKVDTMIIQAIALLDELDKELNTYAMRVKEWYGWHFPEMVKVLNDNILFAKTVLKVGFRTQFKTTDLSDILPEEIETLVKESAEVSMGTEISDEDLNNIRELCEQVVKISEYRTSLFEYLKNRMNAIAPNLTVMVGELVGARLIAHAGSLLNLAKHPASTVQILGAEKALFRALKTKHDTPKYGLIYHASLVGQAPAKLKGKISRMLAGKTALSVRMDALGDTEGATLGLDARIKVETRLRQLEGGKALSAASTGPKTPNQSKYQKPTESKSYNTSSDVSNSMEIETPKKSKKDNGKKEEVQADSNDDDEDAEQKRKEEKLKAKKEKKDRKEKEAAAAANGDAMDEDSTVPTETEKEKKKKDKKRKLVEDVTPVKAAKAVEDGETEKKKKKKDKKKVEDDE